MSLPYKKFRYIYPPRPKNTVPPEDLTFWDNGTLLAQPKLNGSNLTLYTNGIDYLAMNRHGQRLSNFRVDKLELSSIYKGDGEWMILNAEYMNKLKNDEKDEVFNHKFVVFDILAYKGEYLVGTTFEYRVELMDELYGKVECEKDYLYKISENIYRVKTYKTGFLELFNSFTKIDMLEGLVMKRRNAKLEIGLSENNNTKSQFKSRKSTKNYKY